MQSHPTTIECFQKFTWITDFILIGPRTLIWVTWYRLAPGEHSYANTCISPSQIMVSASGVQMGKTWPALHIRLLGVSVVLEGFGWFLSTRLVFPQAVRHLEKKIKNRRTHGNTSPLMWPLIMCLWLPDIARVIWQCTCVRWTPHHEAGVASVHTLFSKKFIFLR